MMNSKRTLLGIALTLALLTGCYDSKKPTADPAHSGDAVVAELKEIPDTTLRVLLDDIEGDTLVVRALPRFRKMRFGFRDAEAQGKILGELKRDKHLAIIGNVQTKTLQMAVNVDDMSGQWFYDMKRHRGLVIDKHGPVSPINTQDISYRNWEIHNGHVIIYYVDMQQVAKSEKDYHADEAQLISLSPDEMVLQLRGKTLYCQRQKEVIKMKFN